MGTDIATTFTLGVSGASSTTVLTVGDTAMRYGAATSSRVLVFATGAAPTGLVGLRAGGTDLGRGCAGHSRDRCQRDAAEVGPAGP